MMFVWRTWYWIINNLHNIILIFFKYNYIPRICTLEVNKLLLLFLLLLVIIDFVRRYCLGQLRELQHLAVEDSSPI